MSREERTKTNAVYVRPQQKWSMELCPGMDEESTQLHLSKTRLDAVLSLLITSGAISLIQHLSDNKWCKTALVTCSGCVYSIRKKYNQCSILHQCSLTLSTACSFRHHNIGKI